jgi:hypothetical protein
MEQRSKVPSSNILRVGFEVLTAVIMKSDITPCCPLSVNRRFGGDMFFPNVG